MKDGLRIDDRLVVITGTGGLGYEAALALSRAGARIVLAGRNPAKGAEAVAGLAAAVPGAKVRFEPLDLASLRSVADFASRMRQADEAIDVLINNAGIMSPPTRQETEDGHELQFGVNYLGHFALTLGLLPLLREGQGARVVSVTSLAQHYAKPDDDLESRDRYRPGRAYCLSKFVQAVFAQELQRRSDAGGWGLLSLAAHPGLATTDLFHNGKGRKTLGSFIQTRLIAPLVGQSAAAGALPILHAATAPDVIGGRLYGPKGFMEMSGPPGECRYAKASSQPERGAALWTLSEQLCGVASAR